MTAFDATHAPLPRTGLAIAFWRTLARAILCAAMAAQAIIWWQPDQRWLATAEQLATVAAGVATFGIVIAIGARLWAAATLLGALAGTLLWPTIDLQGQAAPIDGPRLKVVAANVWVRAASGEKTLQRLLDSDADIIGLSEVNKEWRDRLAPLFERYPYRADCFQALSRCQTIMLSKLPISEVIAGQIDEAGPIVIGAQVQWGSRHVAVVTTHLTRPFSDAWAAADFWPLSGNLPQSSHTKQFANLARLADALPEDLLLMGDLNATPWARAHVAFREATGLAEPGGAVSTWPAWLIWPFALPIDHVLARGHLRVMNLRALERTESDHHPVEAEIAWVEQ